MKKVLSSLVLSTSIALGNPENTVVLENADLKKEEFRKILDNSKPLSNCENENLISSKIQKELNLLDKIIKDISSFINENNAVNINLTDIESKNNNLDLKLSKEELEKFNKIINIKEVQNSIYFEVKDNIDWSNKNILNTLFALIIYLIPYFLIMREQITKGMPIKQLSFILFGTGSLYQALFVAGFIPASSLYMVSILCSAVVISIHQYKEKTGTLNDKAKVDGIIAENKEENLIGLKYMFDALPFPVVKYRKDGYPEIWNHKMQEITGYRHEELISYWEEHGDVMTKLYKGANLEKVQKYLKNLKESGIWYKGVEFTMITAFGEEKTFLWDTSITLDDGDIRFPREI